MVLASVFGALGQATITGTVREAGTRQPMPFASVYLNLTTIGVYTDDSGRFTITDIPPGRYDMLVSHVGYEPYQVKVNIKTDSTTLHYDVTLAAKALATVTITSHKDNRWKAQLQRFHTLFFGNTPLSKECRILNPWVLQFNEDAANGFTATASAPLRIENRALGYMLSYELRKFQVRATAYAISGVSWFQEIPTEDTLLINLWSRRRMESYAGSFRHFVKAMQSQQLTEEGFSLYEDVTTGSDDVVRKASFVSNLNKSIVAIAPGLPVPLKQGNQHFIPMFAKTEVHYNKKKAVPKVYRNMPVPVSWIEVKAKGIEVNSYGMVLNPAAVVVSGEMSEARISALLPYDYEPHQSITKHPVASPAAGPELLTLLERPYLQTDKSYYYPDESIWFRASMNYYAQVYSDTLSKVLLVDLVDSRKQVVTTRIFPIDSLGVVGGSMPLVAVSPGDYQLRAYTRWLLNFDKTLIYAKTIRVLASDEVPLQPAISGDTSSTLDISLAKTKYHAGELIRFSVQAWDDYGFPLAGSLAVAVAPAGYIHNGPGQPSILRDYAFNDAALEDENIGNVRYTIQRGIDISGNVILPRKRRKKNRNPVMVFARQNGENMFRVPTDEEGKFNAPALHYYDTARLSAQALMLKNGEQLSWHVDSFNISPVADEFEVLRVGHVPDKKQRVAYTDNDSTASTVVLEEVIIKEASPRRVVGSAIHLEADLVISGESLQNSDNGDLLNLLQARIPGLRVLMYMEDGVLKKRLKLGGPSSFDRNAVSSEPVVMVDGMVLNNVNETVAEQVSRLRAGSIDRIEVIKFGGGAAYGARGANGVISIYLNDLAGNRFNDKEFPDRSMFRQVNIPGYASPTAFRIPRDVSSHPGNSATIYWNPTIAISSTAPAEISFRIPDVSGDYIIVVEGVSANGKPLRDTRVISIQ